MKDLPNVYQSPIEKDVRNNKDLFYSSIKEQSPDISKKIDAIFHDKSFVYKSKVLITTNKGEKTVSLVGRSGNYLLTLTGEKIKIPDIIDIKKTG